MYKKNDIIRGQVSGIEEYGIFLNFDNQYSGLIHISEIAHGYVKDIHEYVNVGDNIYVHVIDVDQNNKYLKLSIKNINYKHNIEEKTINGEIRGFLPLYEKLEEWTQEKLSEIK